MRILCVEDDQELLDYLQKGLAEDSHVVDVCMNGKDGLFLATTEQYDVILIDRMLPEVDGLTIIKTLRGAGNLTPILIFSALGEVDDRVKGLRSGGDDYLVKPFAFSELSARIEALYRRNNNSTESETVLHARDVELNLLKREARRGKKEIALQATEFRLLEYLLRNKGQIVTRTMLLEYVWDYHFDPQTNVIDVHVSRLRQKIDKDDPQYLIKTRRGSGYIIEDC
ncbi:MAG: response regulator transcription factor [Gammaproteobacteria bacterium]|nr:response regulator transcription factor [Gammaproteobacteria bacterium]